MASQEGSSNNKAPYFTGANYALWKIRMRAYIMSLGIEVWATVEFGYAPKTIDPEREAKQAMNAILNGLCEAEFIKIMHSKTAKDMWDTLDNIHEEIGRAHV